jgi:tetratricopeptide (TPR) repeat protein
MRTLLAQAHAAVGDVARARALLDANLRLRDEAASMQPATRAEIGVIAAKIDLYALHAGRALPVLREASAAQHAGPPAPSLHRARVDSLLGEALLQQGACAQALPVLEHALAEAAGASAGRPNTAAAEIEDSRGRCLLADGDAAAAIGHFDRAIAAFGALHGEEAPSTLRSRAHRLWAEAVAGDAAALDRFAALRAGLVARLGGEDVLQVWQLDLLYDRLARELGRPGLDAARRQRAEAGLKGVAQSAQLPRFAGLAGFS